MIDLQALFLHGRKLEQQGDLAAAESIYRSYLETNGAAGECWFRLGFVCLKQNHFAEAIDFLNHALRLDFKSAESLNLRGVAEASLGQTNQAAQSFQAVIEQLPTFVEAHTNLARALIELDRLHEAVEISQSVLERDRNNSNAWETLANAYLKSKQPSAAIEALQNLLKLRPGNIDAWITLSETLAKQGRWEEAERGFREALRRAPDRAEAFVGLGDNPGGKEAARGSLPVVRASR